MLAGFVGKRGNLLSNYVVRVSRPNISEKFFPNFADKFEKFPFSSLSVTEDSYFSADSQILFSSLQKDNRFF
jgi:hypothetical protein